MKREIIFDGHKDSGRPKKEHTSKLILWRTLDVHQLRLKDQSGPARDGSDAAIAVGQLGGDGKLALVANAHTKEALVPSTQRSTLLVTIFQGTIQSWKKRD